MLWVISVNNNKVTVDVCLLGVILDLLSLKRLRTAFPRLAMDESGDYGFLESAAVTVVTKGRPPGCRLGHAMLHGSSASGRSSRDGVVGMFPGSSWGEVTNRSPRREMRRTKGSSDPKMDIRLLAWPNLSCRICLHLLTCRIRSMPGLFVK